LGAEPNTAAAGNADHSSLHYQAELSVTSTDVSISDDRLINLAPPAAMLAARFSFFFSLRLFSPNLNAHEKSAPQDFPLQQHSSA